jgi:2-aminoadipate transaminase
MSTRLKHSPQAKPHAASDPLRADSPRVEAPQETIGDTAALSQRARWAEGQPISELMAQALANPHLISLAAGFVDQQSLPVEATRQAIDAIFADPDQARRALQYGTTPGNEALREEILTHLRRRDNLPDAWCPPIERVVLTAGSNQLLHLVAESLLDPGDIVLCATPTYFVFLGVLQAVGARGWGVASDEQGILPEALDEALRRLDQSGELSRVKAVYLVPYFDNPRGVTMPEDRRVAVLEVVRRWSHRQRLHVISDDAYRELRYSGEDIPSLLALAEPGDSIIATGTFSKAFSPGIRVGWGVLPTPVLEAVCNQKGNIDFGSPHFAQQIMAMVLDLGLLDDHVERLRTTYRVKLNAMLEAADEHLSPIEGVHWTPPAGGLYVWVTLPETIETGPRSRLFKAALKEGVLYVPGQFCYPSEGEPVCRSAMRLSFGVQSPEKIREGVRLLAHAIRETM